VPLFDGYLFADYSGARSPSAQRQSIRLAYAEGEHSILLHKRQLSRSDLCVTVVELLAEASKRGLRVLCGFDHQYGLPTSLRSELQLRPNWREGMSDLFTLMSNDERDEASSIAKSINSHLTRLGSLEYFYSRTKGRQYAIPDRPPRPDEFRLTEKALQPHYRPMPLCRIGDNGSVGGQSLVGMSYLMRLLALCEDQLVSIQAWPFDGLAITGDSYADAHILVEPFPTLHRESRLVSDADDAICCVRFAQECDVNGRLERLMDLSYLGKDDARIVLAEGWILGCPPPEKSIEAHTKRTS